MDSRRKLLIGVAIGCVVLLAGVMVLAVVLSAREADEFAKGGYRVTAKVVEKRIVTRRGTRRGVEEKDYCFRVEFKDSLGESTTTSSCNRGIDRLYEQTAEGSEVRIAYLASRDDFVLEDWADGKITSFSGP